MYEIFDEETNKVIALEWTEGEANEHITARRLSTGADVNYRYVRHHAPNFVALFDMMKEGQTIDLYRQGHKHPSLTVKCTGDEWSIEINGLSVPFAEAKTLFWDENTLILIRGDRVVAEIERVDEIELENF